MGNNVLKNVSSTYELNTVFIFCWFYLQCIYLENESFQSYSGISLFIFHNSQARIIFTNLLNINIYLLLCELHVLQSMPWKLQCFAFDKIACIPQNI